MDNYRNSNIPLVIAFTPNYFIPAATCLLSILKHSDKSDKFDVIVLLSKDLPQVMKDKLHRFGGERMSFTYLNLEGRLADIYVDEKYTVAASYRLLLPDLLPEYDKVLYIDCDVIVRNNLAELYRSVELRDNYMAGVFEATLDFQIPHLEAIGCKPGEYINSGFLIMNLTKLRQDNMASKFIEASKAEYLEFPDQDVINQLCKGKILGLPPYCNSIRTFFLPQYKSSFLKFYSEKDWQAVQEHGTVHYTGTKPWDSFTVEFKVWWQYYEALPKEVKQEGKRNTGMYLLYKFYSSKLGALLGTTFQRTYRTIKYKEKLG
ncbi:MAG: stress protein [Bacteroidales bacterium 45-6]|nr:MAG: stress protein [Bacteroidales bacterium 45-6]